MGVNFHLNTRFGSGNINILEGEVNSQFSNQIVNFGAGSVAIIQVLNFLLEFLIEKVWIKKPQYLLNIIMF